MTIIYNNIGDPIGAAIYALTNILANTEIMIDYGEDCDRGALFNSKWFDLISLVKLVKNMN